MSNRQPDANSPRKRARQRRPNPRSLAAASAANGDPTALLALDAYELHDRPGQQPDGPDRRHHETADSIRGRPVVGRLLSVNVGLPRNVAWAGKTIRTAIWKEPVDGPSVVRKINFDADDQATGRPMAASTAPCSSTRSSRTPTGGNSSGVMT
jgi:hypothetical protein